MASAFSVSVILAAKVWLYSVGLFVDGAGLNFILLVFRVQEPS
jgi:hypothetical protein